MNTIHRGLLAIPLAAALLTSAACESFSDSSASISNFVSSPVTSLSRSSSPEIAYREDVRDFVAGQIQSGSAGTNVVAAIAEVAKRHGVSDYEHNESTYRGIGAGLRKAGYNQSQMEGFRANVAKTPEQGTWIQRGYDHGV